jgi:hydroxymethylpyrimidine/phosphomethylpyrimidine kinase
MSSASRETERQFHPNAIAMTIAGSDPSGGAGLQADLKTFQQLGVYGASAVTMITIQNTQSVQRIEMFEPKVVIDQIDAIVNDLPVSIAKTGALGNAAVINAVAERASSFGFPLIVDPVMISKHGHRLVDDEAVQAYRGLLRHAFLVTPNRYELQQLTGVALTGPDAIAKAIHDLHVMGAKFVLVKMGENDGESEHIFGDGQQNLAINVNRFDTEHTHGAGCVLSAAIAAMLALGNEDLLKIIHQSIELVLHGIFNAQPLGKGRSPVETRVMSLNELQYQA